MYVYYVYLNIFIHIYIYYIHMTRHTYISVVENMYFSTTDTVQYPVDTVHNLLKRVYQTKYYTTTATVYTHTYIYTY